MEKFKAIGATGSKWKCMACELVWTNRGHGFKCPFCGVEKVLITELALTKRRIVRIA